MDIAEKALPLGEDLSWLWGPESETTLGLVGSAWGLECSELSRGEEERDHVVRLPTPLCPSWVTMDGWLSLSLHLPSWGGNEDQCMVCFAQS